MTGSAIAKSMPPAAHAVPVAGDRSGAVSAPDALLRAYLDAIDAQPIPVPADIAAKCTRDALQFNPNHGAGKDVFEALVRQVDRIDNGWRA